MPFAGEADLGGGFRAARGHDLGDSPNIVAEERVSRHRRSGPVDADAPGARRVSGPLTLPLPRFTIDTHKMNGRSVYSV